MGKNLLIQKSACFFIYIFIFIQCAFAQKSIHISGTIFLDNKPLRGAIIQLYKHESDSILAFTFSSANGYFEIKRKYFISSYALKITHVSITDTVIKINSSINDSLKWNENIILNKRSKLLQEIIIKAPALPFKVIGDTIHYSADKYQTNDVNKLEDLLKKMEGFYVDDDGKISFNGKQVNKILIEGDDLTGSKYRVLSKNIQSDLVSSVQVIQNFNDNWLLKGMDDENGVGINIKIKPDKKNRINGHADFQHGNSGKVNVGVDLVSLNNKIKSLFFISKNNIGNDASEDILYHWNEEGVEANYQPNNQLFNSPLKQFVFPRPDLNDRYIENNNDHSFTSIESIKAGKYGNLKMLGTYKNENKYYAANFYRKFYFPGESVWELNNNDLSIIKGNNFGSKLLFRIDNTKNRIAEYAVSVSSQKNNTTFNEYRSGFEVDTLFEALSQLQREIMVDCKETIKLSGNSVLRIENKTAVPVRTTTLFFQSDRLPNNFRSLNSKDYQQCLEQQIFSNNFDVSVNFPSIKISKVIGVHSDIERILSSSIFANYVNEKSIPILNSSMMLTSTKTYAYGRFIYKVNKKININTQVGLGMGNIDMHDNKRQSNGIYAFKLSTNYVKTAFKQFGISIHLAKKQPLSDDFFPSPLFSGHSTVIYGIQNPTFPISKRMEFNYLRNDLYTGLLLAGNLSAEILSRDNSIAVLTKPRYVVSSFFASPTSKNISANATVEKSIHKLNLKTSIAANISSLESTSKINDSFVNSKFSIHTFHFNVISKWQRKYNFEFNSSISTSSIFNESTTVKNSISAVKYSLKSTLHLSRMVYGSFVIAALQNQRQQVFYSFDGLWNYKINKQIGVNLTLHNILNQQMFFEKQYGIYSYSENNINLIGRIILVGVQWDF